MSEPNKIERTSRQVIERKLLDCLGEDGAVAILATKDDLDLLLQVFKNCSKDWIARDPQFKVFRDGLEQLRKEAFPPPTPRQE